MRLRSRLRVMRRRLAGHYPDRWPRAEVFLSPRGGSVGPDDPWFAVARWQNMRGTWHGNDYRFGRLCVWVEWPARRRRR